MGKRLEQALAEADEIEALEGEGHLDVSAVAGGEGRVSRPNRARSKVLQVRLNPEEFAAVERIAAERGLPVSTIAREQLLKLIATNTDPDSLESLFGLLTVTGNAIAVLRGELALGKSFGPPKNIRGRTERLSGEPQVIKPRSRRRAPK